jgi:hypothetical protein
VEEAQKALLLAGRKPFGEPNEATTSAIRSILDLPKLEQMLTRLFDAHSWQELLDQPRPQRRRRSGK